MKKGISLFFGFDIEIGTRIKMIKDAGFDCVITNADKRLNKQNGSISKQMKLLKKYNLQPSSLHMRYIQDDLPYFWQKGRKGDKIEKNIKKDLKIAKKYGFKCVVMHCAGEYSLIGEQRFYHILSLCQKLDIPIAVENLLSSKLFVEIFKNIKNRYLKFCYDSGHDNCDNDDKNYFESFGEKLITLHLHDNDGKKDQHTLNKAGTIDWKMIAKNIKKYSPEINLDYEIKCLAGCDNMTANDVLCEVKKQADKLEEMIKNQM
ncbi:MAG: sugar phosphate isomerase/epimerase [Clostridiales bacterium]|nr:sugar phosphate isomerase/epimerase [Clostridiales bacterium]